MHKRHLTVIFISLAFVTINPAAAQGNAIPKDGAAQTCESISSLKLPNVWITAAQLVQEGTFALSAKMKLSDLPASCRVTGLIRPTSDSNIGFELWMPERIWNGKYMQIGNGGFGGNLDLFYLSVPDILQRGYAVAGTDDGHQSSDGLDARFAIGHPEKVKDLAWRSVHLTNTIAKAIVAAFYGSSPRHAYFEGCSTGGKEAFMEAQHFPDDFDGIIAGAAAYNYINTILRFVWNSQALLEDPGSYIPPVKVSMIESTAMQSCDEEDGVKDNVISNPLACHFDPAVLLCKVGESERCLTEPQIRALRRVYAGPVNPRTKRQIANGYEPGGEGSESFQSYVTGTKPGDSAQYVFGNAFMRDLVFGNPQWDYKTFDFDKDVARVHDKLDALPFDANSTDLKGFRRHGGKLIQYQGWTDYSVAPIDAIDYYMKVISTQQTQANADGLKRTQEFYRLFMVPGMDHCGFGNGANAFGQIPSAPAPNLDAEHNIITALEQWVERGTAPFHIVATKYVGNDKAKGIQFQRPICPYPQTALYAEGDPNSQSSFRCEVH